METAPNTDFLNSTANRTNWELFDHTDATTDATDYSQKLMPGQAGIAKTYKVYPGDKIKIEAYAKYYNASSTTANITGFATALLSAFNLSAPAGGETGTAASGVNGWGSVVAGGGGNGNTSFPKAFVNLLVFDKNYNFLDLTFEQINGGEQVGVTPKAAHDYMSREYTVKEEGYIYAYLSNENTTQVEVYFDDVVITQTKTNIVQYNEYYPFGLQTSTSWTREGSDNDFLYNAGNELNANNGWYEMHYRGYDPATGRMLQVDPYATAYANHTTYNYALNNPVMINDPSGGQAAAPPGVSETGWRRQQKISEMSESGNYYANWDENFSAIEGEGSGSWMLAKYYSVYRFSGGLESGAISGTTSYQWEWIEDETQGGGDWWDWWFRDKQGKFFYKHWRDGNGQELFLNDEEWGAYMRAAVDLNRLITSEMLRRHGDGYSGTIIGRMHGETGENGYDSGYALLSGSNSTVGNLEYLGAATPNADGSITFNLTLTWHDIMDPNPNYWRDVPLAKVFPGTQYDVHITWTVSITYTPFK